MPEWFRNLPGPRVTVCGRRIHHGAVGSWLIALGVVLVAHDWHDFPWPFRESVD